jgi:hypothetical protein
LFQDLSPIAHIERLVTPNLNRLMTTSHFMGL